MIVVFASTSSRQRALAAPPSARRRSSRPGNAAGSNGSGSTVGLCITRLVLIVAFLGCGGIRSSVPPPPYNPAPTSLEPGLDRSPRSARHHRRGHGRRDDQHDRRLGL